MPGEQKSLETRVSLNEQELRWQKGMLTEMRDYIAILTRIENDREHDKAALDRAFKSLKQTKESVDQLVERVRTLEVAMNNPSGVGDQSEPQAQVEREAGARRFKHWFFYGGGALVLIGLLFGAFQAGAML